MEDKYLYLVINLLTILLPLAWSFEKRVSYYKTWRYLYGPLLLTVAIFIVWDIWFTNMGVWGFNSQYLTGISLINLPIEEWMFFICIPFSSIFIYEVVGYYKLNFIGCNTGRALAGLLAIVLLVLGIIHLDNYYTAYTFFGLGAYLILLLVLKYKKFGQFFVGYAITLIPFFIVNGILTGSGIDDQVVWYNDQENLGIRMFTIPVEDTFYGMLLMLMSISGMEWLKSKNTNF